MFFDRIQKQIKEQTRPSPGQSDIKTSRGVLNRERGTSNNTSILDLTTLKWNKSFYSLDRGDGYLMSRPGFYISLYGQDPHYFRGITQTINQQILTSDNNTFRDAGWSNYYNGLYTLDLASFSQNTITLNIQVLSGTEVSVWKYWWENVIGADGTPRTLLTNRPIMVNLWEGGNSNLSNKDLKTTISVDGGAILAILVYREVMGGSIRVNYNISGSDVVNETILPEPTINTIKSDINQETRNIENTLYVESIPINNWSALSIYRATTEAYNYDYYQQDFIEGNNIVIIDTSSNDLFLAGASIFTDSTYSSMGSCILATNEAINGDFSSYTGDIFTGWSKCSTSGSYVDSAYYRSSAYPYLGESLFGGQCLLLMSEVSNTAKGYRIQSENYIDISTTSPYYLSFYSKLLEGTVTGKWGVQIYDSVDSLLNVISKDYYDGSNSWLHYGIEIKVGLFDSSLPQYNFPYNASKFKVFFSASEGDTSASIRLIDGVSIYAREEYSYFHANNNNEVAVFLNKRFQKSRNNYSKLDALLYDTSKNFVTGEVATYDGNPQYHNNSYFCNFEGAVEISEYGRNRIQNGDFSTSIGWTDNGLVYGNSWFLSPNDSIYGSSAFSVYTNTNDISQFVYYRVSSINAGGSTAWSAGFYAKGLSGGEVISCYLDDGSQSTVHSYTLTNYWKRYRFPRFKFTANQTHCDFGIGFATSHSGSFLADGICLFATSNTVSFPQPSVFSTSRPNQWIRYDASNLFDDTAGTIRLWFTSLLNDSARSKDSYLINASADSNINQIMLLYDEVAEGFVFSRYNSLGTSDSVFYSTALVDGANYYICASWNDREISLYVDSVLSTSSCSKTVGSLHGLYVGCNQNKAYQANGLISNLRIDKTCWNYYDVLNDYRANHKSFGTAEAINREIINNVGIKYKSEVDNQSQIVIYDNQALEPDVSYKYYVSYLDNNNNESGKSSAVFVNTPAIDKSYYHKNLIVNSSFESQLNNQCLYWDTVRSVDDYGQISSEKSFDGEYSTKIHSTYTVESDYIYLPSTVAGTNYYFSAFSSTAEGGNYYLYYVYFKYFDAYKNQIGAGTEISAARDDIYYDNSNNIWKRTVYQLNSTTMGVDITTCKYIKIMPFSLHNRIFYVDALQLEEGTVTSYVTNDFITNSNIASNSISGQTILDGTLTCNKLYAGEIRVDTHTSSGNKIVIGQEDSAHSFAKLTADFFQYHPAGSTTNARWNYTKHVETGFANFGEQIYFSAPFKDWDGNAVDPILIISPYNLKSYNRDYPEKHQRLVFSQLASSSGFIVNAELVEDSTESFLTNQTIEEMEIMYENVLYTQTFLGGWYMDTSDSVLADDECQWWDDWLLTYSGTNKYPDRRFGCTVLPYDAIKSTATFYYKITATNYDTHTVRLVLYGSSQASTAFMGRLNTTTWNCLSSADIYVDIDNGSSTYSLSISNADFIGTKTLGVEIRNDTSDYGFNMRLYPYSLVYSTAVDEGISYSTALIFDTGNQIGLSGATTLPNTSLNRYGNIVGSITASDSIGSLSMNVYATSSVSTSYPSDPTGWNQIASKTISLTYGENEITININSDYWVGANSLAFSMNRPSQDDLIVSFNPSYISYTANYTPTIIDYGATVGAFNWVALDGGLYGG